MNRPAARGRKRKKKPTANATLPLDRPSTSAASCDNQNFPLPSSTVDEITSFQEELEDILRENKRSRLQDRNEESSTGIRINSEPEVTIEAPTEPCSQDSKTNGIGDETEESSVDNRTDPGPITVESPGPTTSHSQEDVMIVGDVQVARPEVIDLERLPTIRQGGSVVVDLTNDASFHDSNVVDLTRETPSGSSTDSSPVIVCVNKIFRGEGQLPSCRFASFPSMLDRAFSVSSTDDEILEVADSNTKSKQNTNLDVSLSSTEDADPDTTPKNKITCPICMDDEHTIKRRKRQLTSTTCGHVFCDKCIRSAVQMQSKCPTCRKKLSLRQLHPIFL